MNRFIQLLQKEIVSTIEGLTGQTAVLTLESEQEIDPTTKVEPPLALIKIDADEGDKGSLEVAFAVPLATALSDLMLGGEGEEQEQMSADDLDAIKEIVSNIFGALSTTLGAQKELPPLNFTIKEASSVEEETSDFASMARLYTYQFNIANTSAHMVIAVDKNFLKNFGTPAESGEEMLPEAACTPASKSLSEEELKNISLIMDVQLPVRVRIGTKTVLLKDVLSMDIGSVVELDQLANEPLDVLVGDKVIAKGEVVIVDGNFGVQIIEIGTPKERLNQLQ
ncbi:MAG: flagellar motor switch protein FliN [Campylobacteraceae bacterium 4484_4]|nr:MAG: flagellar motor switch protein FliN [Campylobacteraceae bacterium 4484_4]